jgi:UV DNA damage endonuclease
MSDAVRYRTITRKRLLGLTESDQEEALRQIYSHNLERLDAAIDFCAAQGLKLYRLSSALFPFSDEPVGALTLTGLADRMRAVGERAVRLGIRMVLHPDQFVVLSSDSPKVVENSVKILRAHARALDLLWLPRSPWTCMELHGGKGDRAARLVDVIGDLPEAIRSRIVLENDERAYGAEEILAVCRAAAVPMVFDAHHHVCREKLDSYDHPSVARFLEEARATWPVPEWQLVHISNGKEFFNDPRHSDLITAMPSSYLESPHALWIEVEAKAKEVAIDKLRAEWLAGR